MSNVFIKIAVLFVVISTLITALGLATPSWITGCLPFNGYRGLIKKIGFGTDIRKWFDSDADFTDYHVCVHYGLFQIVFDSISENFIIIISFKLLEFTMQFFISCLIVGNIILIVTSTIIVKFLASMTFKVEKTKLFIIKCCIGLHLLGSIMSGVGITGYTIQQSSTVHNSMQFTNGIFLSCKREMTSLIHTQINQLPKQPDYETFENENFTVVNGNAESKQKSENNLKFLLKNFDPVFGYSFYTVWLGFGLSFLSWVAFVFGLRARLTFNSVFKRSKPAFV